MAFLRRIPKFDPDKDLVRIAERNLEAGNYGATKEEQTSSVLAMFKAGIDPLNAALDRFVTINPEMIAIKGLIRLIHQRPEPVLITGPTGVGKELLAKALKRKSQPFVGENCAGIPEQLVESIFFGHKKGAFTGAYEDHIGYLEEAKEGIVFLDEIGDMSLSLQAKFLRAIQEMEIRRVGDVRVVELNCRFVAATKYNLEELVAQSKFREDLYARLMTFPLHVTGLISRPEDVIPITKSLMPSEEAFNMLPPFTDSIIQFIYKYNVRAIETLLAQWRATKKFWIN